MKTCDECTLKKRNLKHFVFASYKGVLKKVKLCKECKEKVLKQGLLYKSDKDNKNIGDFINKAQKDMAKIREKNEAFGTKNLIEQDELKKILRYRQLTGEFVWRADINWYQKRGMVAGMRHKSGYRYIKIGDKKYREDVIAWIYMRGNKNLPKNMKHADMDITNSSWINIKDSA